VHGSRFDAWTRRSFGIAAAGVVPILLGIGEREAARAKASRKKRHRHRRPCERLRTACNPDNNKQVCCGALICGTVPDLDGHHCCVSRFDSCSTQKDCCSNLNCVGETNRFCVPFGGS
jgi:hypothetical protein